MAVDTDFDALLQEARRFPPSAEFAEQANIHDPGVYQRAKEDPEGFWAEASKLLDWYQPFEKVMEWNPPWVKWFVGGALNACYNCVDRHTKTWRRNKAALIWEGEPGDQRVLTYQDMYREVNAMAAALRRLGVQKGDRVALYLPMIPELPIAMLACARLGAPHTVIFGGFSPESLRDRINDSEAKVLITADAGYRRGGLVPLKANADAALRETPGIQHVIVVRRVGEAAHIKMHEGRDVYWHDAISDTPEQYVDPEPVDSEHPLYIMYTSGTTGKPKGMLHTTAGYLIGTALTTKWIFDVKDEDVYFCTADIGWVTGHSYIVYGPMALGTSILMYEGTPDYPDKDRFWDLVEKYRATILYTAPTAIRSFMKWGTQYPEKHDLSSLRVLGTVGEPINPEAWMWYNEHIGHGKCPIVDTWWQTETGMILITPLPGLVTTKPGSATLPFPTIEADVVNDSGNPVPLGKGGLLIIRRPWPAIARTIWGDPDRYVNQYFSKFPNGIYLTGDGARKDEDGYFWLLGRVDDVLNVAGHRIGTMEVESALVSHPAVAEAAVIGIAHEMKGQGIAAFVTLRGGVEPTQGMKDELRNHVGERIGAIAKPDRIFFTAELPKTRSAKIMRRLLRDVAEGRVLGDTTTLTDPSVLNDIKQRYEEKE
jgi:acetyl-CoA synthetase